MEDLLHFHLHDAPPPLGDITPTSRWAKVVTVGLAFVGVILAGIVVAIAVKALDAVVQVR